MMQHKSDIANLDAAIFAGSPIAGIVPLRGARRILCQIVPLCCHLRCFG
jgi:hypothetical protein